MPAGGAQRGLGEGDGLPVLPHEQRLVDQQCDDVRPEAPVAAGLCQPQRLVEVALGEPVRVGVVRADARDRHQPARGAVQLAARGIGVAAAQQRRGLGVEEPDDPRPRRDTAGLAVHLLVVRPGGAQHLDVGRGDPVPAAPGDVDVLGRVLPLPHRHHRRGPGDGRGAQHMGPLLFVRTPQRGGPLHEPAQRTGVRGAGLAGHPEPDVVERDGPLQPSREHLADQVRHLAPGPLALQPACHGGVFVPQRESAGAARLVDVGGEAGVRDPRLVQDGVEQSVGLHGMPPEWPGAVSVVAPRSHGV